VDLVELRPRSDGVGVVVEEGRGAEAPGAPSSLDRCLYCIEWSPSESEEAAI